VKLLIVRHGTAGSREEFAKTGQPDDLRPLTKEGIEDIGVVARGLRELVPHVATFATSPLVRARQTADIVAEVYGQPVIETDVLRPDAPYDQFESWAESTQGDVVAVFGHEPHLSGLIAWLIGGRKSRIDLKKGGACLLEFHRQPREGAGALVWLLTPKVVRRLRKS